MAARSSGSHGNSRTEEGGRPCAGLGEAEAHPESICGGGVAGEALWPANSTTASCGSGESSVKLASPGVLFVFDWRGGIDEVVCCASSGQGGRGWFAHWPRRRVAMAG